MRRKISIMLVEDSPEYRAVVAFALAQESELELILSVGMAERGLSFFVNNPESAYPDILLLDLNLPGMSGLESIPAFQECAPKTKIIILTQSDREADVVEAISLGVAGYLLKSASAHEIKDGILTVMNGGASLDPKVAKFILSKLQHQLTRPELNPALTDREKEVLILLGEGNVKKEIAAQMDISVFTVSSHIRHIYKKLNVGNAPAAITKAYQAGILKL